MGKPLITISQQGAFQKTFQYLKENMIESPKIRSILEKYGEEGVKALSEATPKDTGKTSESWKYEIVVNRKRLSVQWKNTNVVKGYANVAVLLQYGHVIRTISYYTNEKGRRRRNIQNLGYVKGIDYINPDMKPIYAKMFEEIKEEVKGS